MKKSLFKLLVCPVCHSSLISKREYFFCRKCKKNYPLTNGIPNFSVTIDEPNMVLSQKKWDEKYINEYKPNIKKELDFLQNKFFDLSWNQIQHQYHLKKRGVFLEIGCGTFYLGRALAKKGYTVVGIDMSIHALEQAKRLFDKEKIKSYLLVCGNVLQMPFNKNSFNLLYGAGVIEHFKDTYPAIKELNRVLKIGGVSYNTVPYLNIGSLTYRQVWGNIPRLPLIEDLYTFIHTKLLEARHMRFGYELSFTRSYLEKMHRKARFRSVKTGQFLCELDFDYLPSKYLKRLAVYLAKNSFLFWPMIYVSAKK